MARIVIDISDEDAKRLNILAAKKGIFRKNLIEQIIQEHATKYGDY